MEYILIIVLTALCVVLTTLIIILAFHYTSKIKKLCISSNTIIDLAADYRISWKSDLSSVCFNEKTKLMVEQSGLKADKRYLYFIFGENSSFETMMDIGLVVKAMKPEGIVTKITMADKVTRVILWKSSVSGKENDVAYIETVGMDITETIVTRRVMEEFRIELQRECDFHKEIYKNASSGEFILYNEFSNTYVRFSDEFKTLLGFEGNIRITLSEFFDIVKSSERTEFVKEVNCIISGITNKLDVIVSLKTCNNEYSQYVIRCSKSDYCINDMPAIVGVIAKISKKILHNNLGKDSHLSVSTGICNRSTFLVDGADFLEKSKKSGVPCAMVCIQIERLQKITTLFGIDVTDRLLGVYVNAFRTLAKTGTIIGKIGSEDFAVIVSENDNKSISRLLTDVMIFVENSCNNQLLPAILKEQARFIAGACFYDGIDDITTLYNKASVTLYTGSRNTGELCNFFNAEVESRVCERDTLEHEIGDAFERGNLELYYQPKIDITTEKIIGAEALMRWNHATRGLVMPGEFIRIAEEIGIITKIDEWGLLQSCMQNVIWIERGFTPIKISVNMSQAQLYQTDLVATVRNALLKSGMPSKYLEIEITETMAMVDIDRSISILKQVKELGITIAMDDFGTGYSSLSSLKLLPIDVLKIDKSLVDDIETNETSRHIATAIVNLGKAMNLIILAEGVETKAQRDILRELGCDVAQGYLYSKPIPAAKLERDFLVANELEN